MPILWLFSGETGFSSSELPSIYKKKNGRHQNGGGTISLGTGNGADQYNTGKKKHLKNFIFGDHQFTKEYGSEIPAAVPQVPIKKWPK